MRKVIIILALLSFFLFSCKKEKTPGCTKAIVTSTGTPCNLWGIRIDGKTFPALNIPDAYKQEGLSVCVQYELYDDMRMCICCGGKWLRVDSISVAD